VNETYRYVFVGSHYTKGIPTQKPITLPPLDQLEVMPFQLYSNSKKNS